MLAWPRSKHAGSKGAAPAFSARLPNLSRALILNAPRQVIAANVFGGDCRMASPETRSGKREKPQATGGVRFEAASASTALTAAPPLQPAEMRGISLRSSATDSTLLLIHRSP